MKNLKAFTLAEVLITLGVIGVVAAMTMPTLIKSYQKYVWTKQLQKAYASLNLGFRKILADEGVDLLSQTEVFNSMVGNNCLPNTSVAECEGFYNRLGKYFKISSVKNETFKYTFLPTDSRTYTWNQKVITLDNGERIFDFNFSKTPAVKSNITMKGKIGYFYIDLNGKKRPNKVGRDMWRFLIDDAGIVYPDGSEAVSEQETGNSTKDWYYWKTSTNPWYSCNSSSSYGQGCTARVLEEGKMNY